MNLSSTFRIAAALALAATSVTAQNLNLNLGSTNPNQQPSNAFGGAANQPGKWVGVSAFDLNTASLLDVNSVPTAVQLAVSGGFGDFSIANPAWSGDDEKLLENAADVGGAGGSITWTFSNLTPGNYEVTTYAIAPDLPATYRTRVAVTSANEPSQIVGGAWSGAPYVQNVTHARHTVTVTGSGLLTVVTSDPQSPGGNLSTVNGFQIKRVTGGGGGGSAGVPFCAGDGTGTACPCANDSAFGANEGCLNSLGLGGKLAGTGSASLANDTLVLNGTRMPNSSALYFQGTAQQSAGAGATFGDGLRCAAGAITRLGTKTNAGGNSAYPGVGDQPISVRGAVLGAGTREYQVWYRNAAAFCSASTFNLTNGLQVTWTP